MMNTWIYQWPKYANMACSDVFSSSLVNRFSWIVFSKKEFLWFANKQMSLDSLHKGKSLDVDYIVLYLLTLLF
jgi:hypothetical protein